MKITKLSHAYKFPGFRPLAYVKEMIGESGAVIVPLKRIYQKKGQIAQTVTPAGPFGMTTRQSWSEISLAGNYGYISNLRYGVSSAGSAAW